MDLKEIIANKNTIISIDSKIKLIKKRGIIKKQNSFKDNIFEIFEPIFDIIGFVIFIIIQIFSYKHISNLIGEGNISFILSFLFTLFTIIIPFILNELYVIKKIKKILNNKENYKKKIHNYFEHQLREFSENISESELEKRLDLFTEEEIKFISLEGNNNLIYINKKTFPKEAYDYIKNNKLSSKQFSELMILFDRLDIEVDKEKFEDAFELSKFKNISVRNNTILRTI